MAPRRRAARRWCGTLSRHRDVGHPGPPRSVNHPTTRSRRIAPFATLASARTTLTTTPPRPRLNTRSTARRGLRRPPAARPAPCRAANPALARLWFDTYRRMMRDTTVFDRVVRGYVMPAGSRSSTAVDLVPYFHDADAYLNDLLRLVPEPLLARHLAPLPETRGASTIRDLLKATFDGPIPARATKRNASSTSRSSSSTSTTHARCATAPSTAPASSRSSRTPCCPRSPPKTTWRSSASSSAAPTARSGRKMERQPRPGARRSDSVRGAYPPTGRDRGHRDLPLPVPLQARSRSRDRPKRADEGWIRIAECPALAWTREVQRIDPLRR